jgi:hypothetical protein
MPPPPYGQPYGFPPPPPPPVVAKRIPEDQPFIVRPSVGKRLLLFGGLLLFLVLVLGCPFAVGMSGNGGGDVGGALAVLACLVVFIGSILGLQLYLLTSGGPILAVGPHGLWIKTRPTRGQAIWLAWPAVQEIYRRRWAFEKFVCVKPYDPRAGNNLGAFTAIDSSVQKLFFGTGFSATVVFADRKEQEIMAALAHFSAGRIPIR